MVTFEAKPAISRNLLYRHVSQHIVALVELLRQKDALKRQFSPHFTHLRLCFRVTPLCDIFKDGRHVSYCIDTLICKIIMVILCVYVGPFVSATADRAATNIGKRNGIFKKLKMDAFVPCLPHLSQSAGQKLTSFYRDGRVTREGVAMVDTIQTYLKDIAKSFWASGVQNTLYHNA